ncbi:MAG: Rrf2 family transcriptional regulator [Planctomycetaceae bacterium]|nr:Rrf2 family transcriptional regulator [Planctomycetaceae bacterium]
MGLSLKCQYAVRALFELARREGGGLVRLREIADAQHIPHRYLENIMNELRQGGFVSSKRGKDGGFVLNRPATDISVGDVVRFIEASVHPVECVADHLCPLTGKCVFLSLWDEARRAVEKVYDDKKLADLVHDEAATAPCRLLPMVLPKKL